MRLIDAIINVERPEDPHGWAFSPPIEEICSSLGIQHVWNMSDEAEKRFKAYPIFNWICTDTHVGLDALYLDDEPVGCTYRSARKNYYEIEWISNETAESVRAFLITQLDKPEFNLMNPDQDIGDDFSVGYVTQALTDHGFYQGRPVKALVWYDGLTSRSTPVEYRREGHAYVEAVPYKDKKSNCVLIQDGDEQRVIPIGEFRLAFNLKSVKEQQE